MAAACKLQAEERAFHHRSLLAVASGAKVFGEKIQ
jgi:hypothetical protein